MTAKMKIPLSVLKKKLKYTDQTNKSYKNIDSQTYNTQEKEGRLQHANQKEEKEQKMKDVDDTRDVASSARDDKKEREEYGENIDNSLRLDKEDGEENSEEQVIKRGYTEQGCQDHSSEEDKEKYLASSEEKRKDVAEPIIFHSERFELFNTISVQESIGAKLMRMAFGTENVINEGDDGEKPEEEKNKGKNLVLSEEEVDVSEHFFSSSDISYDSLLRAALAVAACFECFLLAGDTILYTFYREPLPCEAINITPLTINNSFEPVVLSSTTTTSLSNSDQDPHLMKYRNISELTFENNSSIAEASGTN